MAVECVSKSWRRISMGKLNLLYTEEKVIPNYLKASSASCHDICKYGKKHESESESKPKVSTLKRVTTKLSRDKIPSQNLDSLLVKNRTLTKRITKPSSTSMEASTEGLVSVNNKISLKKMKKTVSSSKSRVSNSILRKQKALQPSRKAFIPPGRASLSSRKINDLNKIATLLKLKSKGSGIQYSKRVNNTKIEKTIDGSTEDSKKSVLSERISCSKRLTDRSETLKVKKGNSLNVRTVKNRKEMIISEAKKSRNKDLVEEKTLYVIKMETENTMVESTKNEIIDITSLSSINRLSRREKRKEESENSNMTEDRKMRSLTSEDAMKDKAMKLKFKKGKVLTGDDSIPKSNGRRSFKTKGNNVNYNEHKSKLVEIELRHREIQKKKDSRRLFNNVIEETASKLVETRKSKVKALVGAFETVISLQESK